MEANWNFPFIHIFWCGFAVAWVTCVFVKHVSDAFNVMTSDTDSPDWDKE